MPTVAIIAAVNINLWTSQGILHIPHLVRAVHGRDDGRENNNKNTAYLSRTETGCSVDGCRSFTDHATLLIARRWKTRRGRSKCENTTIPHNQSKEEVCSPKEPWVFSRPRAATVRNERDPLYPESLKAWCHSDEHGEYRYNTVRQGRIDANFARTYACDNTHHP